MNGGKCLAPEKEEMPKITKKNEIHKQKGDRLYKFCPFCGNALEDAWQTILNYDDSNPVRICPSCDTAWIWHIY